MRQVNACGVKFGQKEAKLHSKDLHCLSPRFLHWIAVPEVGALLGKKKKQHRYARMWGENLRKKIEIWEQSRRDTARALRQKERRKDRNLPF